MANNPRITSGTQSSSATILVPVTFSQPSVQPAIVVFQQPPQTAPAQTVRAFGYNPQPSTGLVLVTNTVGTQTLGTVVEINTDSTGSASRGPQVRPGKGHHKF